MANSGCYENQRPCSPVSRVDPLNLRLDRLEEKVTRVTDELGSDRPRRKGMARITEVIKPAKESLKERTSRP